MQSRTKSRGERKQRRTREQWRKIVRSYEASGQSPREYCREQGLTPSVFGKWNRVFRTEAGKGISPFIELPSNLTRVLTPNSVDKDWCVELDQDTGVILRLR